jgi:hypothetical protein
VAHRTTTSIALLAVLVAGILTPTGMCALMCERHSRAESQRHCISSADSDTMPGMVHDHSAMNHPAVDASSLVMVSQSCQTSCVTAERLNSSRKVVPQMTEVRTAVVGVDTAADSLMPDPASAWSSDSSPPSPPPAHSASFSILRICVPPFSSSSGIASSDLMSIAWPCTSLRSDVPSLRG